MPDRSELDDLKARLDLAALARHYGIPLRQVGKNQVARCPFGTHPDSEASFVVNPERQLFNCFGCQTGGDVFRLVQLMEKLTDFAPAVERVRGLVGQLPAPAPTAPQPVETLPGGHTRVELLGQVADFYARRLLENPPALEYLASRGLGSKEVREAFRPGYADGQLLATLGPELRQALTAVGVLTPKGGEHFAGCVVFPLEHPDEGVVGLYGRKISPWAKVKHLYLPGPKRGVLNWQALRRSSELVLAESVLDALSLWAAGIRDVTSLYGVQGLPPDLDQALERFQTGRLMLCLDDDPPGRQAALRLTEELALRGIECSSLSLGEGRDPNQVLLEAGPEALREQVQSALGARVRQVPEAPAAPEPLGLVAAPPPAPVRAGVAPAWQVEPTGDGFILRFGGLEYRITLRPPFTGRLRVTMRVSAGDEAYIDTFDLYSHRARVTAVKQIGARLGLDQDAVERQLEVLIGQAERWVAEQAELAADELASSPKKRREMTTAEKEQALAFLRRPDLVEAILEHMETLGYIGEERGKLLCYLIGISRRLEKPLSGTILSQSGAGKSGMAELIELLTPPEEVVLYSRLSTQALVYVPKDFLKRKLLIIEERKGAEDAEYSIRVLQSKQRLSSAIVVKDPNTGRMKTQVFEVEGPIAYLETTTNPRAINPENATRCFEIWLDESEEQTRRIHQRQRQARSLEGLVHQRHAHDLYELHHNAQRLLLSYPVHIPFADLLSFPSRWLRTRRDNERFLGLVEAVTLLHQYQRLKKTLVHEGEELAFVVATPADYRRAYELAQDVLHSTFHELTRSARELWAVVLKMAGQAGQKPQHFEFLRRELRQFSSWQDHRLRDALAELVEMEYLAVVGGSQGRAYTYRLLVYGEDGPSLLGELTTPDELERQLGDDQAQVA